MVQPRQMQKEFDDAGAVGVQMPFQIGDRVVCVRVGQCWGETGTITRINNSRWWEQYAMKLDNPAPMFDSVVGSDRTFRLLAQDKETP